MDTDSWLGLGVLLLGLAVTTFAAFGEAGMASLGAARRALNGEETPHARNLDWAAHNRRLLVGALLALKTAGIVLLVTSLLPVLRPPQAPAWGAIFSTTAAALLLLIALQAIPYLLALRAPDLVFRAVHVPLRAVYYLAFPAGALLDWLGGLGRRRPASEEAELEAIVEEMAEEGNVLEEEEREMIRGIIDMDTTPVKEIMVPRIDVVAADASTSPSEVVDLVVRHGFSRIPVYDETIDNIVGVVYAKDLLRAFRTGDTIDLRTLARQPLFVPESKKVADLLKEFRRDRVHFAVVVDEYGGTEGIVSLEDLLEEIVGEIEDEYDRHQERLIVPVNEHEAVVDARVSIDELNDLFGTDIEPQDFATVGGLVYARLGKIPDVGDEVHVDGLTISVLSTLGRRIKKVRAVHRGDAERSTTPPAPRP